MKSRTTHAGVWLAYAWLILGSGETAAQGTIRYVQPPEPIYATQGVFENNPGLRVPFDLDGDTVPDFEFDGGIPGVRVRALDSNAQASALAVHPDQHSWLAPLPFGTMIGDLLPTGVEWVDHSTPRHPVPGSSSVSGCTDSGCIGLFLGVTAYMGVRLAAGDGVHYGWMRIDAPSFEGGGVILDWAYESTPGIPIYAGIKPLTLKSPVIARPGFLRLKWVAEIGRVYQVQAKERLDAPEWTDLNFALSATSTNIMVDLPMQAEAQFFRVIEVD